jgi:hypothetical protein
MGDRRRWKQGVEFPQLISLLCAVEHRHVGTKAAPCEDELFQVVFLAYAAFHNTPLI